MTQTASATPPTAQAAGTDHAAHRWRLLAVIGVAQLMVVLDTTIVNIALPSAQTDLQFSATNRQWIITAYSLAFGSLLLAGGRLSDLIGRRQTLLIGLTGFALASAAGGAAQSFAMLVVARALQGLFAAVLAPAALSTLNVTFTRPGERARALGVFAAVAGGGSVIGLIAGGMLTEWLSWRWCLYVNLLFAFPAILGVMRYQPTDRDRPRQQVHIDFGGLLSACGGLFCLVYGLSNVEQHGWNDPVTIAMLVGAAVLVATFAIVEQHVRAPLLPLRVLADRNRAGAYIAIALAYTSLFGAFLFLTYYFQQDLGYSPLRTGFAFLPLTVGIGGAAGLANTVLLPRLGPRPLVPSGMLTAGGAMFWLAHLSADSTYANDILTPLLLLGLGMGLAFAPSISSATEHIEAQDAGVGSAMVNVSQQVGGAVGIAALSSVFTSAISRYVGTHEAGPTLREAAAVHGYSVSFAVCCGIFLGGAALTALLLRSGRPQADGRAGSEARG